MSTVKAKLPREFGFVSFALLGLILFTGNVAHGQVDFAKRQQERKSSRWTITDWFDTKRRISEQNSWLSANHANKVPVDGSLFVTQTPTLLGVGADLYLTRIGVRLAHQRPISYVPGANADVGGARSNVDLQLRLFGSSIQDTNIVVRAGAEYDSVAGISGFDAHYLGWGVEPEVQIYFAKFMGVWGSWRYRFGAKPADHRDLSLNGNSWKAAAFLEPNALRIEVGYQSRTWNFNDTAGANRSLIDESLFGSVRLFY